MLILRISAIRSFTYIWYVISDSRCTSQGTIRTATSQNTREVYVSIKQERL